MSRGNPLRAADYLEHILQAIQKIGEYTRDIDLASFLVDEKTQDAVVLNLQIIGEACNNVVKHHADFASAR